MSELKNWKALWRNPRLLFGICKSSKVRHFNTAYNILADEFYCNCSAPKPCKHIIALLNLSLDEPESFKPAEDYPVWVMNWLQAEKTPLTEAEKATKEAEKTASRLANRDKRITSMQEGAKELLLWLEDLVRQGLASAQTQPINFWEDFAAQMVDRKLSRVAREIRHMQQLLSVSNDYEQVIQRIAALFLIARGFKNYEQLSEDLQVQLLQEAGLNLKKEDILQQSGQIDYWLVLGKIQQFEENNLTSRKTWLIGQRTGKVALLLDFAWRSQAFDSEWIPGSAYAGELVFYPGTFPLRALIKAVELSTEAFDLPNGTHSFEMLSDTFVHALSQNPWLHEIPILLREVTPTLRNNDFFLLDHTKKSVYLDCNNDSIAWKIIAISMGHPISIFGQWSGKAFQPITVIHQNRIIPLTS